MEIKDTLFTPYVEVTTLLKVYNTEEGKVYLTNCLQKYLTELLDSIHNRLERAIDLGAKGYGEALSTPTLVDTFYEDNIHLIKELYKQTRSRQQSTEIEG